PGTLFFALKGQHNNGHRFSTMAALAGAATVLAEHPTPPEAFPAHVPYLHIPNLRKAMAHIAAAFHGPFPGVLKDRCFGITGTNGKTTTAYILESILAHAGHRPGILGTVNYRVGETLFPAPLTTPDALLLWELLQRFTQHNADALVMEVSSHALHQHRVDAVPFSVVGWTNLTQDHLDYHPSMQDYADAKARLWRELLKEDGIAILNADDPYFATLNTQHRGQCWTFSTQTHQQTDFFVYNAQYHLQGCTARIHTPQGAFDLESPLHGAFNLSNALLATAMAMAAHISIEDIQQGIGNMPPVPGRLEPISHEQDFSVFVDYAHTPDAITKVLENLKPLCQGRLIIVFGCGGDRDPQKRPQMAQSAAQFADICILTSDNPRTEDPHNILNHIQKGLSSSTHAFYDHKQTQNPPSTPFYCRDVDRKKAMQLAFTCAQPNDVVLIAGKGHEDVQIIGTLRYPFDDRNIAKQLLHP
ncbi:MAG: UDP-N-acetylmuramoyl-L-alanyl-D-glutamate--2,6-diaminopimelate ligase, partial [Myxococcota bacterium]